MSVFLSADAARFALLAVKKIQATGLQEESDAATSERLLGLSENEGALTCTVASDGLSLAGKLALEKALREELGKSNLTHELKIYFKRTGSAPPPAPLAAKKAPFGLTIERRAIPGVTEVIVVASGKGGVGKSTVSVNLAVALAKTGKRVGLLDADIYGPSAPLMMGLSGQMPVTGGEKLSPLLAHGVKVVSFGFLTDTQQPVIWRGPLIAKAFRQLCYDVVWGELDYLVIDLPPGTGDIQLALIESLPVHGALIVTTPQDVALLDAHKALTMFEKLAVPVFGLVENMAAFVCPACGHLAHVFGEGGAKRMGHERRVPVLAHIPLALDVRAAGDGGVPVALAEESALSKPFFELARVVQGSASSLV